MAKRATGLKLAGTVDTCPKCGYSDGFHVSFSVKKRETEIVLICPNCSSRYRVDWKLK